MTEDKVDRRLDWGSKIAWLLVISTAWCVKLEMTVSSLKAEADKRQASVEANRANRDKDLLEMTERIRTNEVDISWLKEAIKK